MRCVPGELTIETRGRSFRDVTAAVEGVVRHSGVETGLCQLFLQHTSASLCITENADPDVRRDLERWFADAVPDGDRRFLHDAEGEDDMPAHLRTMLAGHSQTVPVRQGRLALGTWQGVYLWEHRATAHRRRILVTVIGLAAS